MSVTSTVLVTNISNKHFAFLTDFLRMAKQLNYENTKAENGFVSIFHFLER